MSSTAAWRQAGRTLLVFAKSIKPEGQGRAVEMQISGMLAARKAAPRRPFLFTTQSNKKQFRQEKFFERKAEEGSLAVVVSAVNLWKGYGAGLTGCKAARVCVRTLCGKRGKFEAEAAWPFPCPKVSTRHPLQFQWKFTKVCSRRHRAIAIAMTGSIPAGDRRQDSRSRPLLRWRGPQDRAGDRESIAARPSGA